MEIACEGCALRRNLFSITAKYFSERLCHLVTSPNWFSEKKNKILEEEANELPKIAIYCQEIKIRISIVIRINGF